MPAPTPIPATASSPLPVLQVVGPAGPVPTAAWGRVLLAEAGTDWLDKAAAWRAGGQFIIAVTGAADVGAVLGARPDAVLLADAADGPDLGRLDARLAVAEAEHGLPHGLTGIWAGVGTTPAAVLRLGSLVGATRRLRGLVWRPEPVAAALGVGPEAGPVALARSLVVLTAGAAGVPAFAADRAETARLHGFAGLVAGWPASGPAAGA